MNQNEEKEKEVKLTLKQEKFCLEYLKDYNKTQAAIRAGYAKGTAKEQGYENFTKPHIVARIEELQGNLATSTGITPFRILAELREIGFANVNDYQQDWENLKDWSEVTDRQKAAIMQVETDVTERIVGNSAEEGTIIERKTRTRLRFHNKVDALDRLVQHLGFFNQEKGQSAQVVINVSPESAQFFNDDSE